jgi:hypothetical protein
MQAVRSRRVSSASKSPDASCCNSVFDSSVLALWINQGTQWFSGEPLETPRTRCSLRQLPLMTRLPRSPGSTLVLRLNQETVHDFILSLKDRLGDQRGGGSKWVLIKILLQRENSAYAPNSQPWIPTRVCQGSVVTADLPTLGANPKRSQSESEPQRAKDLASPHWTTRTVRKHRADSP